MKKTPYHNAFQAKYYDLIYAHKDYAGEVREIRRLIKKYQRSRGRDLLEVACGTGGHARFLKKHFRMTATDASARMLAIARRKVKGVRFKQADMTRLNLGRQFDVVLCLFSSIGYVKTLKELAKTYRNFARHLKPGGVVIVEPWFTDSQYKVGKTHLRVCGDGHLEIALADIAKARGNISILEFHHLAVERDKTIRYFVGRHELAMFSHAQHLKLMREAGFKAKFLPKGLVPSRKRGVFIGVKT